MPDLQSFQSRFAAHLTAPEPDANAMTLLDADSSQPEARLAIYRNNVYARLIDALASSYPVVARLVGDAFFRAMAREYITIDWPKEGTLLIYGAHFPDFVAAFPPARSLPYLADVARLEQLYLAAYHAPDSRCLSLENLTRLSMPPAKTGLVLHPSAQLMTSPYAVSHIWEANSQSEPPQGPLELPPGPEHLLIIRPNAQVEVRRLTATTHAMLADLKAGESIATALTHAAGHEPMETLQNALTALVAGGTFAKVAIKEPLS